MPLKLMSKLLGKEGVSSTHDKLLEVLQMLENQEQSLLEKVVAEVERSKDFTQANNKHVALQCLKNKSMFEQRVEDVMSYQIQIYEQIIRLEIAQVTSASAAALRSGFKVLKEMQKASITMPKMLSNLFGAKKRGSANTILNTLNKLTEALEVLDKKEKVFLEKVAEEVEKAKEFTREKNSPGAIRCLKKKSIYKREIGTLRTFQSRILEQMLSIKETKEATDNRLALKTNSILLKNLHKAANIDSEMNRIKEKLRMVQEASRTKVGAAYDEDALKAELKELEGVVFKETEAEVIEGSVLKETKTEVKETEGSVLKEAEAELKEIEGSVFKVTETELEELLRVVFKEQQSSSTAIIPTKDNR